MTCKQNRIGGLALLLVFFTVFTAGCAAHHADRTGKDVSSHEKTQASPEQEKAKSRTEQEPSRVKLTTMDDKTVLTLPFDKKVQLSPTYTHPHLRIRFSPAQKGLVLPEPVQSGAIKDISLVQAESAPDQVQALDIAQAKKVQFLISRPTKTSVRVLLVPKSVETAQDKEKLPAAGASKLKDIQFTHDEQGMFFIKLLADASFAYRTKPSPAGKVVFSFPELQVPRAFAKLYRLHKFETPVRNAYLNSSRKGSTLTVTSSRRVPVSIDRKGSTLVLGFKTDGGFTDPSVASSSPEAAADEADAPSEPQAQNEDRGLQTTLFPGMKEEYTGRKISIDLQDADVEHVLRLVAEVGGYNLILDQSVSGNISLKLDEVPWDQALDLVLLQKDLGMVKRGNILRIAPAQKLEQEQNRMIEARKAAIEAKKSEEELAPLQTEYIQVNYTTAGDLAPQVENFLSSRGEVSQDSRTNQLIVNDTAKVIQKVKSVVRKLDRAERQVLIEARLVFASDDFQRQMGIEWSGNMSYNEGSDPDRRDYARSVSGTIGNLPGGPSTLGLSPSLAKIAGIDTFQLDAQLQLGEAQQQVKTVSSPKILTLNNQQAEIQQGTKIANAAESESGGTTIEYTDATLKLSVTPQITPDDKLILTLDISDDSPEGDDISTRSVKAQLIANNEETIVIGGVQEIDERFNNNNVPGVSRIPLLNWLFKNEFDQKIKRELLIFIRPKII
jgi:type IV pilus assembly protein PilQ